MDFAVLISKRAAPDETPSEKARELREQKKKTHADPARPGRERLLGAELGNVDAIALTANDRDRERDRAVGSGSWRWGTSFALQLEVEAKNAGNVA